MTLESLLPHIYWQNHPHWKWLDHYTDKDKPNPVPICRYHFKLLPDQKEALIGEGYITDNVLLTEKGELVLLQLYPK